MASRPKGHGLTRELEHKTRGKYDADIAEKVCSWFNDVCRKGESQFVVDFGGDYSWDNTQAKLKDGKLLLATANKVSGKTTKIQTMNTPFKLMENINNFLEKAKGIGVLDSDLFQTVSLVDGKDMTGVINGMDAFARKTIKLGKPDIPKYDGPIEAEANRREFTEEQLKSGQNVIGLQMGTNKGATASGVSFGASRKIMDMGH